MTFSAQLQHLLQQHGLNEQHQPSLEVWQQFVQELSTLSQTPSQTLQTQTLQSTAGQDTGAQDTGDNQNTGDDPDKSAEAKFASPIAQALFEAAKGGKSAFGMAPVDTDISWPRRIMQQLGLILLVVDQLGRIQYSNSQSDWVLGNGSALGGKLLHGLLASPLDGLRLSELFRRAMHGERLSEVDVLFRVRKPEQTYEELKLSCLILVLPDAETGEVPLIKLPDEEQEPKPILGKNILLLAFPNSQQEPSGKVPELQDFYKAILNVMPAPLVVFDAEHRYLFCNSKAIKSKEIRSWIIGKTDQEYVEYRKLNPAIAENRTRHFQLAIKERKTVSFEEKLYTPHGGTVYHLRTYTPVFSADGTLSFCVGHGIEITELKQAQKELEAFNNVLEQRMAESDEKLQAATDQIQHDAFHDTLTGLPNRALFEDRLSQAMNRARQQIRSEPQYAVLFLDTDRFKGVNDTFGHPVGDVLLTELAARLKDIARPTDTVARLGGDEFALLIEPLFSSQHAEVIAEQIQNELRHPLKVQNIDMKVSVSIGVVMGGSEYEKAMEIMRDADIAMYSAKETGRGSHQVFKRSMREKTIHINQTESELHRALERNELRVTYQPIVRLIDQQVIGLESLVRWQHPTRGLIGPNEFIHVAEEASLMLDIDRWMINEACIQMQRWQHAYPKDPLLSLSLNISAKHFGSGDLVEHLHGVLQRTAFDPKRLNLEITEGAFLTQPQQTGERLRRLKKLGIGLHLDDFGTGYSSLSYLHTLPLDVLKIDRSFIQSMIDNDSSAELVRTIVAMAKNMGMDIVAEGIENQTQLSTLQRLSCEYGQGFLFAKPQFWQETRAFVATVIERQKKQGQRRRL